MSDKFYIDAAKQFARMAEGKEQKDMTRDELVNSHLLLAVKFAHKYSGYNVDVDDLISQATIGLIKAAEKFDHTKGKFSTIASLYMKYEVLEYVMKNVGQVEIKRGKETVKTFFSKKNQDSDLGAQIYGAKCGYDVCAYEMEGMLDANDKGIERVDIESLHKSIRNNVKNLDERDSFIVESRYLADKPMTCKELGEKFGVGAQRIDQLSQRAIKQLRGMVL